jgi:hypothetical protein
MRLRDASIDDVHLELLLVIDEAGGDRWTRLVWALANRANRAHRHALLLIRIWIG